MSDLNQLLFKYLPVGDYSFELFDEIDSTNRYLRSVAEQGVDEWNFVVAEQQSLGRGRLGRSFFSPPGYGVYMSILLRPKLAVKDALLITTAAAVAAAKASEKIGGRNAGIKWVNDIFMDGRKVCGILVESAVDASAGALKYAVLGVGFNVAEPKNGFPDELQGIAGSILKNCTDDDRVRLIVEFLGEFRAIYEKLPKADFMNEYRRRSIVIGKTVNIVSPRESYPATVIGIDDAAGLLVRLNSGEERTISTGEISLRF